MDLQKAKIELQPEQDKERFGEYLYEKECAEATIKKYMTDIGTFFRFLEDDYQVDKKRIVKYKEWLCVNYAASSVNSMLAVLNQFLDFFGAGMLKVKRLKIQKQLFLASEKELTINECKRLICAAYGKNKIQLALGIEALASTGARISELTFFTVEMVKKGMVEIRNKGKQRTILLPAELRKKLLYYAAKKKIKSGSIFITRNGKAKDRSNFWREMKALKKAARVSADKIFPHNLRHLFARMYYKTTKDLSGLADLLGHSSLDVTRLYTAVSVGNYKRQIERLGILIE